MSRRKRKPSRPKDASAAPSNSAAATDDATAQPGAAATGSRAINRWQVAEAAARNLLALVGTMRWSLPLMDTEQGSRLMRAEFTLVFGRWLLALAALMAFGAFLGGLGAGLVIVLYTALMIYTDLYPERFLRWLEKTR